MYGKSKQEVQSLGEVVIRGLESLNMKARLATVREIEDLIALARCKCKKDGLPSQIPFLTPFAIEKIPSIEKWADGIFLGRELTKGIPVFWNVEKMQNPHLLVIGPTGSGKTELLLTTGTMMTFNYSIPIVFFDVKGDIGQRLRKSGFNVRVLNPFYYSLNLLTSPHIPPTIKPLFLEKIIGTSFQLNKEERAILFDVLNRVIKQKRENKLAWGAIIDDSEITDRYSIKRSLEIVSDFDWDGPGMLDSLGNGINVIDLTQLKDETLRRFIIYSFISLLYARYSLDVDKGLRIGVVIDEAWTILRGEDDYGIVGDIIKRGRGHGIALLMATQNVQDLGENADIFMENFGVICFMNNGDKDYWRGIVKRYSNILESDIENKLTFLGRGEMIVRFLGDPRPLIVSHEPLTRALSRIDCNAAFTLL
ncbi:helicase HerA domain-containing protein [Metallosphaera hakonensis]|uniref:helicase HerA domain-containing protein n=1 Tax=Metallosphaera hakonensis TaxID=79601 RepID=UPI000ABEE072|nr:DUF87 domain-containing protein [Metallosphaera hakonensis]